VPHRPADAVAQVGRLAQDQAVADQRDKNGDETGEQAHPQRPAGQRLEAILAQRACLTIKIIREAGGYPGSRIGRGAEEGHCGVPLLATPVSLAVTPAKAGVQWDSSSLRRLASPSGPQLSLG